MYAGDSIVETFLSSLNITFRNCVKIEKDTRSIVVDSYGLSCVSLALRLVYYIEFSYVKGILMSYVQKLSILVFFKTYQTYLYFDVMRLKLKHFVLVHENGLVIQPSLCLLAVFPDGLVVYQISDKELLLELKCPHIKRHMSPIELAKNRDFYMNLKNGKPVLK